MLYLVAENPSAARQAFKRVIDDTSATSAERAKTILMAMQGFMRNEGDSGVAVAESYLPTLDALPDVVVPRFQARQLLLGWYLNYDIDDKILVTAPYMLQLAKSMTAAEQQQNGQAITMAYQAMASYQANRLHPDSALAILHQAPTDFPTLASLLTQGLASTVTRYEMIGKKVPALHADYWINKEAKFPAGNASILLFTANWCHSCRDSYPTVVKLNDELKSKGLQTVLAVTLDGVFEGKAMTPDEEVEANRKYFVGEHKFTFPIAVQRPREGSASGEGNVQAFEVGAYPDFVVVDKTGIVRAVLLGWDPYGNRAKALTTVLNQLL
jgi:thiol-disulfide isomerase/thioredoxin